MRLIDDIAKNAKLSVTQFAAVCEIIKKTDAVEVIRCKDCKCAYINSFSAASGVALCKKWSNEAEQAIVQQDDFCSYGERRTNES